MPEGRRLPQIGRDGKARSVAPLNDGTSLHDNNRASTHGNPPHPHEYTQYTTFFFIEGPKFLPARLSYFWTTLLNMAACLATLFQITLVVFLCAPEGLRGLDHGDNALRLETALGSELLNFGASLHLLLRRVVEDG